MRTIVLIIMILSGIIFMGSVMLMSPKGGIGFWLGGMSWAHEHGSKKSLEWTLKRTALRTAVIFCCTVLILPYLQK